MQAGSGWAVGWKKPEFWGRAALVAEKEAGPARRLRGLRATGRGVPRAGDGGARRRGRAGRRDDLGHLLPDAEAPGIALALIDTASGVDLDDPVSVDVRGRALPCTVVKPPFVPVARALTRGGVN